MRFYTTIECNSIINQNNFPSFLEVRSLWPGGRGDCFSILLDWDYGNGMWVDFDCSAGMAYVCTKRGE